MQFTPERGDVIWLTLSPQAGHEQSGRRPVVVLSPSSYNRRVGLALCCPITNQVKGYPLEVVIPVGLPVAGVVLADQVRSLDWRVRQATFITKLPDTIIQDVLLKLNVLLAPKQPPKTP